MAAKKPKKPASMTEALGIKNIFGNEKFIFVIGIVILAVAIYFLIAFISFFTTGEADRKPADERHAQSEARIPEQLRLAGCPHRLLLHQAVFRPVCLLHPRLPRHPGVQHHEGL